jgi:hypothetical protein
MFKLESPLIVIIPRKTKDDKKIYLNLNVYRNLHFIVNNQAKEIYCKLMEKKLKGIKFKDQIDITFTLFKSSNRKIDRSNVLSIVEKFFCDALVHHKCIPDDNDDYIKATHYKSGGLDRENPRVEIEIK